MTPQEIAREAGGQMGIRKGSGWGYALPAAATGTIGQRVSQNASFFEVKADNRLFIIRGEVARQRFQDLVRNTPSKAFSRVNASWVKMKRKSAPYQEEIEL